MRRGVLVFLDRMLDALARGERNRRVETVSPTGNFGVRVGRALGRRDVTPPDEASISLPPLESMAWRIPPSSEQELRTRVGLLAELLRQQTNEHDNPARAALMTELIETLKQLQASHQRAGERIQKSVAELLDEAPDRARSNE